MENRHKSSAGTRELPINVTEMFIRQRWRDVIQWAKQHPEQLVLTDARQQSVLHLACLYTAPSHVFRVLLGRAPGLASTVNEDGEVSLHWAVRLSLSEQTIRLLLKANPTSGVFTRDSNGITPLHIIWDRHKVSLLRSWEQGCDKFYQAPAWNRIILFLQLSYQNASESQLLDRNLHIASSCPTPKGLFSLVLKAYRHQIYQRDDQGRTPLAVACTNILANTFEDPNTKIEMILSEDTSLAQVRDNENRQPFHVAVAAGFLWNEGVCCLIEAHAGVLEGVDPVTGLCPFALAEIGRQNRKRTTHAHTCWTKPTTDAQALVTVWNLLKMGPLQPLLQRGHQ